MRHVLMRRAFARLVDGLSRRRSAVLLASVLVCAALAAQASRLRISPDWVGPFLPRSDPRLAAYADALHRFGDTHTVYVDVAAADREATHAAADSLEAAMRASGLFARVFGKSSDWDAGRTFDVLVSALPLLLDDEDLAEVESRTRSEALSARMEEHYERLLGPVGGIHQDALARDPLELTGLVLDRVSATRGPNEARFERGRLVSGDGRHALLSASPVADVGDEEAAERLEEFFAEATARLDGTHPGATVAWVGGHRHYRANALAFRRDMTWVSALAVTLVLGVIFVGFRGARITWISAVAVVVGGIAGAAALATAYPEVSGISLGFGAALSGISVDYVIHLHAERRAGETRREAVRRTFVAVGPTVLIGAITSAAGFLVLLASDIPAHGQLGLAAGAGIGAALLFAMFPGPLVAAAGRTDRVAKDDPPNVYDRASTALFGSILRHPARAFAAGALLVGLGAAAATSLRFESDIRRFEVRDAAVDRSRAELSRSFRGRGATF
jgi:predicted exporter